MELPRSKRGANRMSALLNWFNVSRTRRKAEESWRSFSQCVATFLAFPVKPTPLVLVHIVICNKQIPTVDHSCQAPSHRVSDIPRLRVRDHDWREDLHASFRDLQHILQVYRAQRRFSCYVYQLSTLLQRNTCCAFYRIRIVANANAGQGLPGTRNHDHVMRLEQPQQQRYPDIARKINEVCQGAQVLQRIVRSTKLVFQRRRMAPDLARATLRCVSSFE